MDLLHPLIRATILLDIPCLHGMNSLFMSCILAPLPKVVVSTEWDRSHLQVPNLITYVTLVLMPLKSCRLVNSLALLLQGIIPPISSPLRMNLVDRTDFASL